MFKRRNAIIAFLLVAVLLLGVGYAALTDSLTVNGKTVEIDIDADPTDPTTPQGAFDGAIGFSKAETMTADQQVATAKDETENLSENNLVDTVSFTASQFSKKGDKAVIKYTIKNTHPDLSATISVATKFVNPASGYYSVITDWDNGKTETIAPNGTTTVTVTVEMVKTPQNDVVEESFTMTLNVESSETTQGE